MAAEASKVCMQRSPALVCGILGIMLFFSTMHGVFGYITRPTYTKSSLSHGNTVFSKHHFVQQILLFLHLCP